VLVTLSLAKDTERGQV